MHFSNENVPVKSSVLSVKETNTLRTLCSKPEEIHTRANNKHLLKLQGQPERRRRRWRKRKIYHPESAFFLFFSIDISWVDKKQLVVMYVSLVKCLTGKRFSLCAPMRGSKGPAQFNNSQGRHEGIMKFSPATGKRVCMRTCARLLTDSVCLRAICFFGGTSKLRECSWQFSIIAPRGDKGTLTHHAAFCSYAFLNFHIKATWDQMSYLLVSLNEESLYQ